MEVTKNLMAVTLFVLLALGQAVMAAEGQLLLWQGNVTAEVHGPPADLVWPFFVDFCKIYKIFPLRVSYCVGKVSSGVGQHRYNSSIVASPLDGDTTYVRWEKHSLTAIGPVQRSLSYELMESNLGVTTFRATVSVSPADYGSLITWAYTIDPFPGFTCEQFRLLLWSILQRAAKKIGNAFINLE